MSLPVAWSPIAKEEYAEALKYVDESFGADAALKLLDDTEKTIDNIAQFPEIYPLSIKMNVRKAVVSRQSSVLYRITPSEIQILHFWDNRQGLFRF